MNISQSPASWTHFTVKGNFYAPVDVLYRAWTTREGLESWFLRSAEFFTPDGKLLSSREFAGEGNTYKWLWFGFPDDVVENRQVLEANGTDLFSFVFSGGCKVTVRFIPVGTGTVIELTQENIPMEEDANKSLRVQCNIGWTFYMANLKSIVEGGIDLRNKDMELLSDFK